MRILYLVLLLLFTEGLQGKNMLISIQVSDAKLDEHYIYLYKLGGNCIDSAKVFNSQCQFNFQKGLTVGYEITFAKDEFYSRRLSFLIESDTHNIYLYRDRNESWHLDIDSNLDKEFMSIKDSIITNFLEFFRSSDGLSCSYLNTVYKIFIESMERNRNMGIYLTFILWEEIELLIRDNKNCNKKYIEDYQINVGKILKDSVDNDINRLESAFNMLEGDGMEDFVFIDKAGNIK